MDVTTILKSLDVSLVKVFFLRVFNKEGLIDYLFDKANTAVNALIDANQEKASRIRTALVTILSYYDRYSKYVPTDWLVYAEAYAAILRDIVVSTEDGKVTKDELSELVDKGLKLYAMYMAD